MTKKKKKKKRKSKNILYMQFIVFKNCLFLVPFVTCSIFPSEYINIGLVRKMNMKKICSILSECYPFIASFKEREEHKFIN